jgi:hypothetical protein
MEEIPQQPSLSERAQAILHALSVAEKAKQLMPIVRGLLELGVWDSERIAYPDLHDTFARKREALHRLLAFLESRGTSEESACAWKVHGSIQSLSPFGLVELYLSLPPMSGDGTQYFQHADFIVNMNECVRQWTSDVQQDLPWIREVLGRIITGEATTAAEARAGQAMLVKAVPVPGDISTPEIPDGRVATMEASRRRWRECIQRASSRRRRSG